MNYDLTPIRAALPVLLACATVSAFAASGAGPAFAQGPRVEANRLYVAGSWRLRPTGDRANENQDDYTLFIQRQSAAERVVELQNEPVLVLDSDPTGWFMDVVTSVGVPGEVCPTRESCLPARMKLTLMGADKFVLHLDDDPDIDDLDVTFERITCPIEVQPQTALVPREGAFGQAFRVTAANACSWSAASSDTSWLRLTGAVSGVGTRDVTYEVIRNVTGSRRTGTIRVTGGDALQLTADLTVTQDSLGAAVLELTLDDAPFRGVPEGQQSPPVTATVRNTGDQLINLTGVVACPPRFVVTSAPAGVITLPPNGSFEFRLVFAPGTPGQGTFTCDLAFPPYGPTFRVTGIGVAPCDPGGRPAPPDNFNAAVIGNAVSLTWTAAARCAPATGYVLEAGSSQGASNLLVRPLGNVTAFSASAPTGRYFVRLRATNGAGASDPTPDLRLDAGCTAPPGPPVNLTTSLLPTGAVQLSWGPGSGNLVSYLVEVGTRPGAANIARVNVAAPATSFSGTGSPGTYYLRVRAENTCGLSLPSAEVWIVIGVSVGLPPPPGPPTASASGSTVSVSWTAPVTSDPVTGYVLEAGSAPGLADLATLNVGAVTSYTASNVPAGRYYLRVRATTAAGTGPPSVEVTVEVR